MYRPKRPQSLGWILAPFKWVGRGIRWLIKLVITKTLETLIVAGVLAYLGYLGYQSLPEETKQVVSIEGLQELTSAIRDAIDRSHQIEESLTN